MNNEPITWDKIHRDTAGRVRLLYRHERLLSEPFMPRVKDVLDVGGWGVLATRLIEDGYWCTILDAFTADQNFPERVRGLPHVVGDVKVPATFTEGSFDLVTCYETLEHVGGVAAALQSVRLWLRRPGWFVGTIPIPGFCHFHGEPGIELMTTEAFKNALIEAGFTSTSVEPTGSVVEDEVPCSLYFRAEV